MNRKMNHEKNFEMREIKFRAKDWQTNKWVYGFLFMGKGDDNRDYAFILQDKGLKVGVAREDNAIEFPNDEAHLVDKETICQSTELIGEYDREIFEGDIVDWTFFYNRIAQGGGCTETDIQLRGVIKWSNGGFIFEVWRNDFEDAGWYGISDLNFDPSSDIEVIGNIYDNPDLVEG